MCVQNPENFFIPPAVIKRHLIPGQFVELRIDSPRFSVHEESHEKCVCPSCNGELTKPILRHENPEALVPLPDQNVPSRGWGEDFWVQITERSGRFFMARVENRLVEKRLHGIGLGNEIALHEDHVLAVHGIHRHNLISGMDEAELKELARLVEQSKRPD